MKKGIKLYFALLFEDKKNIPVIIVSILLNLFVSLDFQQFFGVPIGFTILVISLFNIGTTIILILTFIKFLKERRKNDLRN